MRKDGFILQESCGIRYYSCAALERIPQLCHGFSTRIGGEGIHGMHSFNLGHSAWDSVERVEENRSCFLHTLSLGKSSLITAHQIHSDRVLIIEDTGGEGKQSEGDALVTAVPGVALGIKVADCLPVLIADPAKRVVAAVHSGWRGTVAGILANTIRRMQHSCGSRPQDLLVAVGPGIRSCCFEVGSEVVELFERRYPSSGAATPVAGQGGKHLLDLCKVLDIQLDETEIPAENRYDLGACTCCNTDEFFSYRSEGAASGRLMAVIGFTDADLR